MAAKLTSSGVTFGDNTSLSSKYGIIPQSSVSVFFQTSAPTGWTKITNQDNKTLRVVSGSGGGAGGSTEFSTIFPTQTTPITVNNVPVSGSTGNTTLTTNMIPAHAHPNQIPNGFIGLSPGGGDVASGTGWTRNIGQTGPGPADAFGGLTSHNHPFSTTISFSSSLDLRLKYIDVIICSFS